MERCEKPFWEDLRAFFSRFNLTYAPNCENQIWNFIARIGILGILCGLVCMSFLGWGAFVVTFFFASVIGFVVMYTTPMAYYPAHVVTTDDVQLTPTFNTLPQMYQQDISPSIAAVTSVGAPSPRQNDEEGFVGTGYPATMVSRIMGVEAQLPGVEVSPYSGPALPSYTPPTARNPFMNVLLDEYKYNPRRPEAVSVGNDAVKQTLDDYFRVQWYSDPTDVYGKTQSQRMFVTQPSTSVPNDQTSFANWCWKLPGLTCKEGGRSACTEMGSSGQQYPWLGD